MAFVISRLCEDCAEKGCVTACPVECIYRPKVATADMPARMYISDECIDCTACVDQCQHNAIYPSDELPEEYAGDAELNALCNAQRDLFELAVVGQTGDASENAAYTKQEYGVS
jgi:ferredoxin